MYHLWIITFFFSIPYANIGAVISRFISSVYREKFGWSCLGRAQSTWPAHCRSHGDGHFFYWLVLLPKTRYIWTSTNGPFSAMATSLCNSQPSTLASFLRWSPLYNGHLSLMATSPLTTTSPLQGPSLYNGIIFITAAFLPQSPFYNGHLSLTATSLEWPPLFKGHLSTMATSVQDHLCRTATSLTTAILLGLSQWTVYILN